MSVLPPMIVPPEAKSTPNRCSASDRSIAAVLSGTGESVAPRAPEGARGTTDYGVVVDSVNVSVLLY